MSNLPNKVNEDISGSSLHDDITLIVSQDDHDALNNHPAQITASDSPVLQSNVLFTTVKNPNQSPTNVSVLDEIIPDPHETVPVLMDNLAERDKDKINIVKNNYVEITRLIRALPNLTPLQIRILEMRYVSLLQEYEKRLFWIDINYHVSRGFVSLGSVAVPALLSIQSPSSSDSSLSVYWLTWTTSLLVTIFHNFSTLFRFDKRFFGIHSIIEKLRSEGWQYLELSGRYSGYYGRMKPTHQNQFIYFVSNIEKIRLKQTEDEFNAVKEADTDQQEQRRATILSGSTAAAGAGAGAGAAAVTTSPPLTKITDQMVPSPLDLNQNRGIGK